MIKPFQFGGSANLFGRGKTPGLNELCALLNLEEAPCALIDQEESTLLFINSSLIRLSGFSHEEVANQSVQDLFPDFSFNPITSGEIRPLQVKRRDQPNVQVEARLNYLDAASHWLRVSFSDPTVHITAKEGMQPLAIARLLEFSALADCETFLEALAKGAEIIHVVSGAQGTAIYQADAEAPQFRRVAASGEGSDFPETLPMIDSLRLSMAQVWDPGTRVLTEIHKFGRMNGYAYIASAPLSEGSATVGLIVCGGKGKVPSALNEDLLTTVAGQVRALQQHYLLVENLEKENRAYTRLVNLLEAAFNNINEGVVLLSTDCIIQHINPAAEWILGYSSQEVQGQEYDNVLIGTDRLSPALAEATKGVATHNIGKVNLNRRNGQSFPALVQVVPVIFKEALIGIEIILNDVSENESNKALAEHLEHRAVLGDYTAAFAHDIRNPINNISLGIQLMASTLPEDDPNQEVLTRVQNDCTRLSHLMESFLAFSRPSELNLEVIDVGQFLQRILDRWHPRLANAKINPFLKIEPDVGKIMGDSRALDRVFTNLISNAVDAMSASGDTLAIKAELNSTMAELPMVEISVSDNGPGIPDELKDRIFEPFVSASKKGTGLGLAITKQIVSAHKGSINLKTFPGGTVFIVSLPAYLGESE